MVHPLFSIVIASYNFGQYLEQAIVSVLNQDFSDYELIIIDGGSTDNSVAIIKKYEKDLGYWISEKDNGQSDAFNKGFTKARGQFYFWVNADDVLLPGSLRNIHETISKNPKVKWFAANTVFFDQNNKILSCKRGPSWNSFLIRNAPVYVYGPSSIFHKTLFEKLEGFDLKLHYTMDTDLWIRFTIAGEKFKRINKYVWGLRIHVNSKTSHAFNERPNASFATERNFILQKNGWRYSYLKIKLQFLYKLFGGVYLLSLIDSYKLKNKEINKL